MEVTAADGLAVPSRMEMLTVGWEDLKPPPGVSFLVATAAAVERDAILNVMRPLSGHDRILKVHHRESTYFLGSIGRYPCALVLGEPGSDTRRGSALETLAGIELWDPLAVLAPGIAFGRRIDAKGKEAEVLGDVLVSTQVYPYSHAKLTPDGTEDRGPRPEASIVLLDRVKNSSWTWVPPGGKPRAPILGPLLSGPYVLNDAAARDDLLGRFPQATGGEMEATGIYSACNRLGKQWIVIKAVCDWGAGKGDDYQRLAARNAADLVVALLSEQGLNAAAFRQRSSTPAAENCGWQRIDFAEQGDLRPALSGDSMGPAHVVACPPLPDVDQIVRGLEEAGSVAVVGPSGSGKSMAAWHAAYRLHQAGWGVYVRGFAPGPPPATDQRVLLVVDDVQAFAAPPVTAALATGRRRLLLISTDPIPGFRRTVRIIPKAAVAALAEGLLSRAEQLVPILRSLDSRVGEGAFHVGVGHKIEAAKRASKLPWQFMFNLGSGHLRLDAALKAMTQAPPRDTVLFAIAARQLATMDGGADLHWLRNALGRQSVPTEDLGEMLDEIAAHIALVRVGGRISTPHPEVADRIVTGMFVGLGAAARKAIYWEMFDDPSVPLGGLAWLATRAPDGAAGAPEGLVERLLQRCREADDAGHAGFVLATLLSRWSLQPQRLRAHAGTIRGWISAGVPEHAYGLARLVNELLNADRSGLLKSGGDPLDHERGVGTEIVGGSAAGRVAAWANAITLDDAGAGRAELLERLATACNPEWCAAVGALLDRSRLAATVRAARVEQLDVAANLVAGVGLLDQDLAYAVVREATPAITEAMRTSLPAAYVSAGEIFGRTLGFRPKFLRRRDPDGQQRAMMCAILEGVGADSLAAQFSRSRRRDWNAWRNFSEVLRDAAPELAAAVGQRIDVEPLVLVAGAAMEESTYEVDELLVGLALAEGAEPAATLVRRVYVPRGRMSWVAAFIAPDAAVEMIEGGVTFSLALEGGLPRWGPAATILAETGTLSVSSARRLLRANADGLADGLLFRQADGVEGAVAFLRTAVGLDDETVLQAFRRIAIDKARSVWRARLKGGDEEQVAMKETLALAKRAGGQIGALAAELEAGADRPETEQPSPDHPC